MDNTEFVHYIREKPLVVVGGAVLGLSLIFGGSDNIRSLSQQSAVIKQQRQEFALVQAQLQLTQQESERLAEIAVERYQEGCVFVFNRDDLSKSTTLQEGFPVLEAYSDIMLPNGTPVCDVFGNTGIIADGIYRGVHRENVTTQIAFTGDREVVAAAMERAGIGQESDTQATGGKADE